MSAAQPIAPAKAGGKGFIGKVEKYASTHKPEAFLGVGAVGAVGIALYRRSHASSSTSTSVPAADTSTDSGDTAGGVSYDPTASDGSYDPMQSVLDLQTSLDSLSTADAAALASLSKTVNAQGKTLKTVVKQTAPPAPKKKPPAKKPPAKKPTPKKPAAPKKPVGTKR